MIIGIDLGTTNSAVAFIDKDNNPQIIPNSEGGRVTPSVIYFEDDNPIVGTEAKNEAIIAPEDTIQYIKRKIGDKDFKFARKDGELFSPEELSAIILKKLKKQAEGYLGEEVSGAVITVPAYFTDAQRKATQDAGNIAGLNVLKIINEPTAAALAYGLEQNNEKQRIMIYDLGGGTFDVVVMEINNKELKVLATNGNRNLGGFDFDNALLNYVLEYIENKHGIDLFDDVYAMEDLREKVEEAKKSLSNKQKTSIVVNASGIRDKVEITQELFNSLISGLIEQTIDMMKFTLEDTGLNWSDIDKTILVGGSSRIKLVRDRIEEVTHKKPSLELNPDEVVAIGAAYQGKFLDDKKDLNQDLQGIKIIDVNSHGIGFSAMDNGVERNYIMIEKNTPIPTDATRSFYTLVENQNLVTLKVCEGDEEDLKYVNIIGETRIKLPAGQRPKGSEMKFFLSYDKDGLIKLKVWDAFTDTMIDAFELKRDSNLTKEEVVEKTNRISNIDVQ